MRNLVIARITEILVGCPDLMTAMDISPDELENLSNLELLDLLEELY